MMLRDRGAEPVLPSHADTNSTDHAETRRGLRASIAGLALLVGFLLPSQAPAAWEANQCVACHQVEQLPISLGHSMDEWRASAHARAGIGCEKCHGGDASSKDASTAHRGVLPASDPASLVSVTKLAATCGSCHEKQYKAYLSTDHAKEIKKEGEDAATCLTCHGSMATSLPSPAELNSRCTVCHDKPVEAKAALSVLASTKIQLHRTSRTLAAAKSVDPAWQAEAMKRFHDMERSYEDITLKWHTFKMDAVIHDSHDLLRLGKLLDEEATLKMKMQAKQDKKEPAAKP